MELQILLLLRDGSRNLASAQLLGVWDGEGEKLWEKVGAQNCDWGLVGTGKLCTHASLPSFRVQQKKR